MSLGLKARGADSIPVAKLLDLTHDAIFVRGVDGAIQYWNRAAEDLYGWTAAEALGKRSRDLLKTVFPQPVEEVNAELERTGRWEGELVHTRRDGAKITVASRWSLQRDAAGAPAAILQTSNDITARKLAEAERANLEERLRLSEKMEVIGRFASGIAHDFNNVLGGITAYGEMLFDDAAEKTPRKRYAQNVLTAATRGRDLIEQLLAFTRSQRGKQTPTDVCRTVAEAAELVRSSLPGCITLTATIPDEPLVIVGDATQLHQVVMNLCSNAVHAMAAGGPLRVTVSRLELVGSRALSHGSLLPGTYACVRVEDGGCGMDEATLARIFEPFFTTREAGCGSGLGLALVSAIVTDFGGLIDVKSVTEEGSAFSIYLPMAM